MATRQDFQMLNDALGNLGNAFVVNRTMDAQKEERQADRDLRERMLQEQIEGRKEAAAARNTPQFTWKSGGVQMNAHSLDDFSRLVQQHPADMDEEGSTIDLTGQNEHGVQVHQRIKIPKGMPKTPETQRSVATAIKGFADLTGVKPKAAPSLTPVKLPGYKGALGPNGAYIPPDADRLGDVDRAELATINKSLMALDAETRKLAESGTIASAEGGTAVGGKARALNAQRQQLETRKKELVGKYKEGEAGRAVAAGGPSEEELVTVTNPQGKTVRIRKAQLSDALAQGYKQP